MKTVRERRTKSLGSHGDSVSFLQFSRGPQEFQEHCVTVFCPDWACGDAAAYHCFAEALLVQQRGGTVLVPEFNINTPPIPTFRLTHVSEQSALHPTQKQKQHVYTLFLAAVLLEYGEARQITIVGYSEGAVHTLLTCTTLQQVMRTRTIRIVLICPAGLAPAETSLRIRFRTARNLMQQSWAWVTGGLPIRKKLATHTRSVSRYRKEYPGSGSRERVSARQIDLRDECRTLADKLSLLIIACRDDALSSGAVLEQLCNSKPCSIGITHVPGNHFTIFTDPKRIVAEIPLN